MSSDSDDDIFGEKEEEETENVTKKDDKDIFGSESENEQNEDYDHNDDEEEKPRSNENEDDENSDKQNDDNYDENRNEAPVTQQDQEAEIEYGPPEILDYHPLPNVQKSAKLFHVRIPNILGIDPKPFDPNSYEEVKPVDEEGNPKKTYTNPETVIRWRYELDSNGIPIRQTNSKFVRWSDGSLGLFIGNELYDVTEHKSGHDHNYLFVRQKKFIQCQGLLPSKLTFRPASLVSKTHVKLTASVGQRHKKERKIKIVHADVDPDKDKAEKEKLEEDRISSRVELEQAKMRKRKSFGNGLTTDALEYSDDESGSGNIGAIKERFKKNKRKNETAAEKRLMKSKTAKKRNSNRYEDEEEDLEDDYDDDDYMMPKKRTSKKPSYDEYEEEDEDF